MHPEVTSLFRYRGCPNAHNLDQEIDLIKRQEIWCTSPGEGSLNDPFDCQVPIKTDLPPEEYLRFLDLLGHRRGTNRADRRRVKSNPPPFSDTVQPFVSSAQRVIDQFKICCFSSDPENFLMWSYYGNSHKGICIEYERNDENGYGVDTATAKIRYEKGMSLDVFDLLPDLARGYDDAKHYEMVATQSVLQKCKEWEHEEEFRFVGGLNSGRHNSPGKIIGVTFGFEASDELKRRVVCELDDSMTFYGIERQHNEFRIRRVPLKSNEVELLRT